jgi:uncharacterized membrane protein
MNENAVASGAGQSVDPSLVTYTHIIYGLHAFSVVSGIVTSATIVGSFIFARPSIIAVIMNYARRSAVKGTYLESHFRWQIRTFWGAFIASCIVAIVSLPLVPLLLLGVGTWIVGAFIIGIWVIYRVARGWMALRDRRLMYA